MIGAALHDVLVQVLAAQIEEAVFEPDVLRIFLLAEHRHRQFAGRPQHLDLADIDLDRAGRQIGILGAAGPPAHLAVDAHHPFRAQRLGDFEGRAVGVGDDLGEAVMIAQIDEQHAAMVADAMAPARQPDLGADVARRGARRKYGCGSDALLEFRQWCGKVGAPPHGLRCLVKRARPAGTGASTSSRR